MCSNSSNCEIIATLSVLDGEANGIVSYPNPVHEKALIDLGKPVNGLQMNVFDSFGHSILTTNYKNASTIEVDTRAWEAGIYTIVLTSQNTSNAIRIVKE